MSKYSLKEVSELLNIPKSTLRYWEDEHIIRSQRDPNNDYRTYSVDDLVIIIDMMFYRNLNVSIDNLRDIYNLSIPEHVNLLEKNDEAIDYKIKELLETKGKINKRMNNLKNCLDFINDKFDQLEPPFQEIHGMTLKNTEDVTTYITNLNLLSVVFKPSDSEIQKFGLIHNELSNSKDVVWRKDPNATYVPCVMILVEQVIDHQIIDKKIEFVNKNGMCVKQIIGHYLASDQNRDYYQCWLEVVD